MQIKREEIEKISDEQVMELAKTQTHSQFFDGVAQKKLDLLSYGVSRRDGLHVTIDLKFKDNVNENHLRDILDDLSRIRMKAAKNARQQRKKEFKLLSNDA